MGFILYYIEKYSMQTPSIDIIWKVGELDYNYKTMFLISIERLRPC